MHRLLCSARHFPAVVLRLTLIAAAAAACGGGGSGGGGANSAPPVTTNPPAPPSVNQPPVLVMGISTVKAIGNHPLNFDASQGGKTFSDPDGDVLSYTVLNNGRETSGPWLSFIPSAAGGHGLVGIVARDGRGGEATHWFEIDIALNAWPKVARSNAVLFATAGQHVNHDLAQGGTTFTDADGDALVYAVELTSPPGRGFDVAGTNAVGSLVGVGVANFKITASDGYGGTATDTFIVAIPAPLPGSPHLPATSYVYADEQLPLPYDFRRSFEILAPFWDTARTQQNRPTNAGATLGRVLFYDKRLSILNTVSCGTCHQQAHGFATAERFPVGVQGVPLKRNAMGLANNRYNLNENYFADGRALNLENLVPMPIEEPLELGNSMPAVVEKLRATPFYGPLFTAAFGTDEITAERIATAMSQFLRSIVSYRARFDQAYSRMDDPELQPPLPPPDPTQFLTPTELRGVELFHSSGCDACHHTTTQLVGSQFNTGLELVPIDEGSRNGAFRAASLRNVALTAPYMHDGRFATLREVIEHYDHGVIETEFLSDGLRESRGGPVRRLNLTEQDKVALEAFLLTLTDAALTNDPKFSDPF